MVPQNLDVQLANVLSVNGDFAGLKLHDSGHSHAKCGFTSTCATHDSNLFPGECFEAHIFQDQRGVGSISQIDVLKLDLALGDPVLGSFFCAFDLLLRQVLQIENFLGLVCLICEVVDATGKVHEPSHVCCPVEQKNQCYGTDFRAGLGNEQD